VEAKMAEMRRLKVLGVCGSLRKGSFNRMALDAAIELAPPGLEIERFDIAPIPPYNEDVRAAGFPPVVEELRAKIKSADALLIATPEYNFSIPGVLKNAIDWASRPPDQPFNGKPVALLGASAGVTGTARSQQHLRQVCSFLNMFPVNKPEVLIGAAASKFNAEGKLVDEATRGFVRDLMAALEAWTRRLGA
jgi:chromate reductase